MKWYKVCDGIGSGCTGSLIAAGVAMGIASAIGIWNNFSTNNLEIDKRVTGVLQVAGVIIPIGTAGAMVSAFAMSRLVDDEIEDDNAVDHQWERLISSPQAWNGKYCAAACKGCKHLVGHVNISQDKFMVCGMHPYGWRGLD